MVASGRGNGGQRGSGAGRVVSGRYQLEEILGQGGMGTVWRATDTLIQREVALKELRPPVGDDSFVERALREARNAGRLNHPGVVGVHDVIAPTDDDDAVYIVMEFVEAPSLDQIIEEQGPLPPHRVGALGAGIVEALMAAHAMGIVHRDIKPANVLVKAGDRVKLTDFGIALAAEDNRLTRSGVMGTHSYLAPESFDGGDVGPATDLWALGATLFHAVAGRPPFERDTTTATLRAILFEEPPPVPCPPPLADVIRGLLTRSVDQRLTSSAALERLQEAASMPPPAPAPPAATPGQPSWQGQSTTFHRPPSGPTPAPAPPPAPPPPAYTTGQNYPPAPAYVTGRHSSPPQQPQRSNTPLLVTGAIAAAVALIAVILIATKGSDDDGTSANGTGSGSSGESAAVYTDADRDDFVNECTSQLTQVTEIDPANDPCTCIWNAIEQNIPADVYREAMAAQEDGGDPAPLPPEIEQQMEGRMAACVPDFTEP